MYPTKYIVTITPLPKEYVVEADSPEEAFDKAEDLFFNDLFSLETDVSMEEYMEED